VLDSLATPLTFHHVGYACKSIATDQQTFERLGYTQEGSSFEDARQGVRGLFLLGPGPRIELLENLPDSDTLTPWLNAGIHMYHLAYTTPNLQASLDELRGQRARVVVTPVPAIAFQNRLIAFVMMRNQLLVELIESL
jgi:methylmalonyl-CoA/ethylmalonyl-CoA epimerase